MIGEGCVRASIATYYRNEFETAFERLKNPRTASKESFTSNTGWW